MGDDREQRVRALAHRMWEEQGRPEGRAAQHWREAEQATAAEEAAEPAPPEHAATTPRGAPPADPLRNPEPFPPALDPEYPAITGPEQIPNTPGARASLNPEEIVDERAPRAPQPEPGAGEIGERRPRGGADVPLPGRPGGSTLE